MASTVILCLCGVVLVHLVSSQAESIPNSEGGTGLSQIDLEAEKDVTVCTKQKKPLSCAYPGSNIAITNVFWGRRSADICPSDDGDTVLNCDTAPETLGIVKAKCEGKESCELEARHALLQNPKTSHCPGVNKYLIINYTCVPDAKEVVLCNSENSTLTCPATWKIGVNSVFWGRQSTVVCPAENGQTTCTGAPESLGIVKKSCDGLTRCDVHASYDQVQNGAENCPGVGKYLIINYSCKPHPNIETEDDYEVKQSDSTEQQEKPVKQEEEPAKHDDQPEQLNTKESVAKALKQLDGDPKSMVQNPSEGKEDLNIGRLGMGGLKALEKINNLIKASAEAQGGDESLIENGLTDEQAQTIERMIIEGIQNIKNKTVTGTRKTSIPRKTDDRKPQSLVKLGKPEVKDNTRSNINVARDLKMKIKNTLYRLDGRNSKPSAIKGLRNRINDAATRNIHLDANQDGRNVPVLRNAQQNHRAQSPNVRSLGIGNAGAGNQP